MSHFRNGTTALIVAVLAAAFVSGPVCAEDKKIAVVNVSDVFQRFDRVKDVQDKLKAEYDPKQVKLQERERGMKQWKERIEIEEPTKSKNDRGLFQDKQKFQIALFDLQSEYEALTQEVEKRRKDEMKAILTEITRVIGYIGKAKGYDLVMRAPEYGDEFDPARGGKKEDAAMTAPELVRRFRDNPVLYFAEGTNITDDVINQLNKDYKASPPAALGGTK